MSTPAKPPTSASESSLQPTRQLLDELDSLMQRMLALPVNQLNEELGAAGGTALAPLPQPEETPISQGPTAKEEPPPSNYSPAQTQAQADRPLASPSPSEEQTPGQGELASEESVSVGDGAGPPPLAASPEVLAAIYRQPRPEVTRPWFVSGEPTGGSFPEPAALWLRPLLWSNHAFDRVAARLGGPGRWLSSDRGRALMGWLGLGLLAGAFAWLAVHGFGWTG